MANQARRIIVTGRVQGVGYRPFVYNKAIGLGLNGTVYNGSGKVFIHAEGHAASIDQLEEALVDAAPPLARPQLASSQSVETSGTDSFEILASEASTEAEIHVPPDLFTCDDCVAELTGPEERRFGYPFINCTQCGPRYTIITAMPYDRPNTSMADFPLCDNCRAEYESPMDRRFHAQPLACPVCGPQLELIDPSHTAGADSSAISTGQSEPQINPLQQAIEAIDGGRIVAIKGVGGYHLVCDAANDEAVARLRERKHRPHKPLAVMFPIRGEDGLVVVRESLELDEVTSLAITDPSRPIVLARKHSDFSLSPLLAPGLDDLGVFLPYSPLHHQLLLAYGKPIVATSGNISGEPVITDNDEAQQRLAGVADVFLHHDRPIVRPADDPVIRPMAGRPRTIRLGRGIAPLERSLPARLTGAVLATGGHMKVTVALGWGDRVVISPHIGDLDSPRSNDIFNKIINSIQNIYDVKSQAIACDLHPGYSSSRWAEKQGLPLIRVQHHVAHASALAGEHPEVENWLVFAWDGVGYGSDGTLWGGEALAGRPGDWNRKASFRPFNLVGGDKAGREPWRSAAALMWAESRDFSPARPALTNFTSHHEEAAPAGNNKDVRGTPAGDKKDVSPAPAGDKENVRPAPAGEEALASSTALSPAPSGDKKNVRAGLAGEEAQASITALRTAPAGDKKNVRAGLAGESLMLAREAWKRGLNTHETSAAGRLFDAAAALILGRNTASFEGQGPMELEHIAIDGCKAIPFPLGPDKNGILRSDWAPLLDVLSDQGLPAKIRAGIFHETMAQALVDQALAIRKTTHFDAIGLSGGVFQNRRLTERVLEKLQAKNIEVRLHQEIPANDGGLSFGQIIESLARQEIKENATEPLSRHDIKKNVRESLYSHDIKKDVREPLSSHNIKEDVRESLPSHDIKKDAREPLSRHGLKKDVRAGLAGESSDSNMSPGLAGESKLNYKP